MKNLGLLIVCFCISLLTACNVDKCEGYSCTTPPATLHFSLEGFDINDDTVISITNVSTKKVLTVEKANQEYICNEIGWEIGEDNKNYVLTVAENSYPFIYHTEKRSVKCCALLGELKEFSSGKFIINSTSNGKYKLVLKK